MYCLYTYKNRNPYPYVVFSDVNWQDSTVLFEIKIFNINIKMKTEFSLYM